MTLEFQEYEPRRIVNVYKHVDGSWFWNKYSAHPYIGCRSGCEFCYCRGGHYLGKRTPESFDTLIQVKTNAVELLRKELSRLEPDVINCGDWQQPAEDRYQLSRQMLEVVHDLGFPLIIIERSPLLTRDLDLLVEINRKSWVCVAFSLSNINPALKRAFEPRSPGIKRRLEAMEQISTAGILVGASLMPVIPVAGDDRRHLEEAVRAIGDHGGSFVLASGLTMDGLQAERSLEVARKLSPDLERRWSQLFHWQTTGQPAYSPPRNYSSRLGMVVRELCQARGIGDRIPRYIPPGPLATNKRIAELLFLKTYALELEQERSYRIWAYRKAAWTIDEWPEDIGEMYRKQGDTGLQQLPDIGKGIAGEIAGWLMQSDSKKVE